MTWNSCAPVRAWWKPVTAVSFSEWEHCRVCQELRCGKDWGRKVREHRKQYEDHPQSRNSGGKSEKCQRKCKYPARLHAEPLAFRAMEINRSARQVADMTKKARVQKVTMPQEAGCRCSVWKWDWKTVWWPVGLLLVLPLHDKKEDKKCASYH